MALTGAASGIGQALAVELARHGAKLAPSDLSGQGLQATQALLPPGTEARLYGVDVSSSAAVFGFADQVLADFSAVAMVVNNAGTAVIASVEHVTLEEMERVLQVNLWGVVYGTKAFLPAMLAQRSGCIVNIASVFGLVATPCSVAYTISKFGVRGLTETLWQELDGTGVRSVLVQPGGIETNISNALVARQRSAFEQQMAQANLQMMTASPADVVAEIVTGLQSGARRLLVGNGPQDLHRLALAHPDDYGDVLRAGIAA